MHPAAHRTRPQVGNSRISSGTPGEILSACPLRLSSRIRRSTAVATLAGAIIGGILGGIIASQARPYYRYPYAPYPYAYPYAPVDPAIAYCIRRYRSYDPYSMTYLGNDGYRHPCP